MRKRILKGEYGYDILKPDGVATGPGIAEQSIVERVREGWSGP
jgi:hypothetical protein